MLKPNLSNRTKTFGKITITMTGAMMLSMIKDKTDMINALDDMMDDLHEIIGANFIYEASLESFIKNKLGNNALVEATGLTF